MRFPRFKKRRRAYYGGFIDAPSVVLMVAGLALWLIWPSRRETVEEPRVARRLRVSYAGVALDDGRHWRGPLPFYAPQTPALELPAEGFSDLIGTVRKRRARMLQRDRQAELSVGPPALIPSPEMAEKSLRAYSPQWARDPVFLRYEGQDPRLVVRCAPALRDAGFEPPALEAPALANGTAWEAVLSVRWDEDGKVLHVLLERGSENTAINAAVVRAMHRADLGNASGALSGRIVLSYGKQ